MDTGLIFAAAFCTGRKHDFHRSGIELPPHVLLLADADCEGVTEIHPNSQAPFKKNKPHPLDKEQKTSN
ncbi:MAG: hypothetical protein ACTFAL_07750 [Candidatus Electronema sp. V4]|uniref:hypothetical protein n=1 Tax=Candidatus Electronema sp. V4 TaxID=3454756 RepID=UPI00405581B2